MPKVKVNDITPTMSSRNRRAAHPHPYLAADNACYAFQVADYAKHFTRISC
jgi:hypothetical protein